MKHLERLRKVINLAYSLEWIVRDPFEKFSLKYKKVEKEFFKDRKNRMNLFLPDRRYKVWENRNF